MLKSSDTGLSRTWTISKRHGVLYTGGALQVLSAGTHAASLCGGRVAVVDLETGQVDRTVPEEIPVSFSNFYLSVRVTLHKFNSFLIICIPSLLLFHLCRVSRPTRLLPLPARQQRPRGAQDISAQ